MNVSKPHESVSTALDIAVLVALDKVNISMSGRAIANKISRSHVSVNDSLARLIQQGTITKEDSGLYILNRNHLAYPAIAALSSMRSRMFIAMRENIAAWELVPTHAGVFGSTARSDGNTDSDIDIFLVCPKGDYDEEKWEQQVIDFSEKFEMMTGNIVNPIEYDVDEIEPSEFIQEVIQDEIILYGKTLTKLLK